jgi:hypothetical protein
MAAPVIFVATALKRFIADAAGAKQARPRGKLETRSDDC